MKVIYKIVNTLVALLTIPVLLFLPMFRFIVTVGVKSENQILSLIGGMLDINEIIMNATGIDLENLPEYYTIKNVYDMFLGDNAQISASEFDTSLLPDTLVKFFTAAAVLFAIALVCVVIVLILGLFTKKKTLTASFSALGFVSLFAADKCFTHISSQLVSGKISLTSILSGMESLAQYKDYLSYVNIDIRIFEIVSAGTMLFVIFGALILLNIGFKLAESVS